MCLYSTPSTVIYTLSLHDALPISWLASCFVRASWRKSFRLVRTTTSACSRSAVMASTMPGTGDWRCISPSKNRSEEHTSELQSRRDLVCRLLLEKKKKKQHHRHQ